MVASALIMIQWSVGVSLNEAIAENAEVAGYEMQVPTKWMCGKRSWTLFYILLEIFYLLEPLGIDFGISS